MGHLELLYPPWVLVPRTAYPFFILKDREQIDSRISSTTNGNQRPVFSLQSSLFFSPLFGLAQLSPANDLNHPWGEEVCCVHHINEIVIFLNTSQASQFILKLYLLSERFHEHTLLTPGGFLSAFLWQEHITCRAHSLQN